MLILCCLCGALAVLQIASFGKMVGQSFEAQALIAMVNTILTTMGLIFLKIPGTLPAT